MKKRRIRIAATVIAVALLLFAACVKKEEPIATMPDEIWDYVALGSSIGTWWAEYYGDLIESQLGVKIRLHNYYVGSQRVGGLLHNVMNNEGLREDIRNAEIITVGVGFVDMYSDAVGRYEYSGPSARLLASIEMRNDRAKLKQNVKAFGETYDALLDQVLSLSRPTGTLIRVMDFYFPFVHRHKELGIYTASKRYWKAFNKSIVRAARKQGIPVARVFLAYNGSSGDDDPVEKGYIDNDGRHPSEYGLQLIAAEFHRLGYTFAGH